MEKRVFCEEFLLSAVEISTELDVADESATLPAEEMSVELDTPALVDTLPAEESTVEAVPESFTFVVSEMNSEAASLEASPTTSLRVASLLSAIVVSL